MKQVIHLNNAGASMVSDETMRIMVAHLKLEQSIGGYEAATFNNASLEEFYAVAGKLVGCDKNDIAFFDSATRAWNTLIFSMKIGAGDKIITTTLEYGSNILSLQSLAEKTGAELIKLAVGSDGYVDIEELTNHLDERVKLVAASHAPAHCGTMLNVNEIGKCLDGHAAVFLVDACQTLGQLPISVAELRCDALVGTGRKWLRGPRGTAFIYVSEALASSLNSVSIGVSNAQWLEKPQNGSHVSFMAKAKRLESWERSMAGQLGLTNAIKEFLNQNSVGAISKAIQSFRAKIEDGVRQNNNLVLYPSGNKGSGIVTFHCKNRSANSVKIELAAKYINVSVVGNLVAPWDFSAKQLPDLIRVSPHYINNNEEILSFCKTIQTL